MLILTLAVASVGNRKAHQQAYSNKVAFHSRLDTLTIMPQFEHSQAEDTQPW